MSCQMKIPNLWQLPSLHGNLGGFVAVTGSMWQNFELFKNFAVPSGKYHVNSDIIQRIGSYY